MSCEAFFDILAFIDIWDKAKPTTDDIFSLQNKHRCITRRFRVPIVLWPSCAFFLYFLLRVQAAMFLELEEVLVAFVFYVFVHTKKCRTNLGLFSFCFLLSSPIGYFGLEISDEVILNGFAVLSNWYRSSQNWTWFYFLEKRLPDLQLTGCSCSQVCWLYWGG